MEYLVDSNVLIDAYNKWYKYNNFPSIWNQFVNDKRIITITPVYNEIIRQDDDLSKWLKNNFSKRKENINQAVFDNRNKVINWIKSENRWNSASIADWSNIDKADPFLIANAMTNNRVIVSFDGASKINNFPPINTKSKKEPKISSVAHHFRVKTIALYDLISLFGLEL